jgi:fatty acid synthase
MRKGDKVLIHSGSGGVGQAAIQVALFHGCEVFTTVGTEEKRQFIRNTFPQISDSHIFSSRDTNFEKGIMNLTRGKGVNLILNSLSDDKLQAGLRLLSYAGKFLEIGKYDASINTQIGMEPVLYDCSVQGIGLDNIIIEDGAELELVHKLLAEGISNGMVKPITKRSFSHDDVESAFRFMAKGEHIGKVIVQIKEEDRNLPPLEPLLCTPRFWCDPAKTYLITGGLGGFGLELADWLVQRGAKLLCLTSRSGISNGYQRSRIDYFKSRGVDVTLSTKNVALREQANELIHELSQIAPIGGVFHLAMVMKDAFFTNQPYEAFNQVVNTKLDAALNLDIVTREQCKDLEHFILFSSLVGSVGNTGQSAYAYANSGLDQLAFKRRQDGLSAVSIQWGAIADVGFVAENRERVHFESIALNGQSLKSCLATLDRLLFEAPPVVSSHVPVSKDLSSSDSDRTSSNDIGDFESLTKDLMSILGLPADSRFDEEKSFMDYGMDSLMGVEITQKLERDYHIQIPQSKIKTLNIAKLRSFFSDTNSPTGPATGSYNFIPEREFPIFDRFDQNDIQDSVVYFLTGLLADPFEPLITYPPTEGTTLFAVRYEHAESFEQLSALWKAHLESLPDHVKKIKIIGYSTGATITHRVIESIKFVRPQSTITSTTISPPDENLYLHLQEIELGELQQLKFDEGMERLQKLPIWGDYSMIPFNAIKKQVSFLMAEDFFNQQYASVDLIVLPSDDPVCWSLEKSKDLAQKVEVVDGSHDIRNICLTNYYN